MRYDEVLKGALIETTKELDAFGGPALWAKRAAILAGTLLNRQVPESEVSVILAAVQLARLSEQPGNLQAVQAAIGALAVVGELHAEENANRGKGLADFSKLASDLSRPTIPTVVRPVAASAKKEGA